MNTHPTTPAEPHPAAGQILALLREGHTNTAISQRLHVRPATVAEIRREAGIPAAPRSAWRRAPHPQADTINRLLAAGHTDAEISRQTGATPGTVARYRREGGFGPATVRVRTKRRHPRYDEIRALLPTASNQQIALKLGVDRHAVARIRKETNIPYTRPGFATAEEKWASLVRPVDGGHLEWLGERSSRNGTPIMRFRGASQAPAGIAFKKRTGRDPVGVVKAECGFQHCMAPEHVEDGRGRHRVRAQLRVITGGAPIPEQCRAGHPMADNLRIQPDGARYCAACKRAQKQARRTKKHTRTTTTEGTRP